MSASQTTSLSFDATSLIKYKLSDEVLARVAASGSLRSSSCRSAVWRLVLRCLPYETKEWEISLSRSRNNYRVLKETHLIDPHDTKFTQDPELNNPLASAEQSPWKTFFEDSDLRDIIGKDVSRTFPEIEFFQEPRIRQMLSDILLVYAKEHPFTNYRQGMHEVLAPLIFVIYLDNEAFQHAKENNELKMLTVEEEDILNCLFCKDYLEHDSYNLFCAVMLEVSRWFEDPSSSETTKQSSLAKEPFMRVQDSVPSSRLMEDFIEIGKLLQEIDPTLAKHLSSLDIPPQLYGIRWLRLLFGREIPLHDLLFLWDVLLIDRPITKLAHCIFVSLLVQIRHLLLGADYGGCLQYLMRYPPIADIDSFVKLARHYRNPKKNAKPVIKDNNFSHITVAGSSHPNRTQRPLRPPSSKNRDDLESPPTILALAPVLQKVKNTIRDRSNTVSVPSSPRKSNEHRRELLTTPQKTDNWTKEVQMMEEQVSALQIRLNEQDMMCCQVSKALEMCAENVRCARTSEECVALSQTILELSRTLVSIKTIPVDPSPPRSGSRNADMKFKVRDSPQIRQINEMVDLATKRAQM